MLLPLPAVLSRCRPPVFTSGKYKAILGLAHQRCLITEAAHGTPIIVNNDAVVQTPPALQSPSVHDAITDRRSTTNLDKVIYTHNFSTLDPARLTPSDWVDFRFVPNLVSFRSQRLSVEHPDVYQKLVDLAFNEYLFGLVKEPVAGGVLVPGVKPSGFFYYHTSPDAPPLAGELRFRVTQSNAPNSFASGHDAVRPLTGRRWSEPLMTTLAAPSYGMIQELLLLDDLVSHETMELARRQTGLDHYPTVIHAFRQPFVISFSRERHYFVAVGRSRVAFMALESVTRFVNLAGTIAQPHVSPFLGRAICCFEPYALPNHPGKRFVVLRVLESLGSRPIRPNPAYPHPGISPSQCPRPGSLVRGIWRGKPQLWIGNVDSVQPARGGLRHVSPHVFNILYENESLYGPYRDD